MRRLVSGLIVLAITSVPVHADDGLPVKLDRGTRLRLYPGDGQRRIDGRIRGADDTTITLDTGGARSQRFSRDQLGAVMYRTARRDRGKGAAIGAAITGLAGMVACGIALSNERAKEESAEDMPGQGGLFILGLCATAGALPGAAIGFAIGAPASDWHSVRPNGFTMAGAPPPRRTMVAVKLRFGR